MIQLAQSTSAAVLCSVAAGLVVTVAALVSYGGVRGTAGSVPDVRARVLRWRRRRLTGVGVGLVGGAAFSGFDVWALGIDRGGSAAWLVVAVSLLGAVVGMVAAGVPLTQGTPTNARVAHSRHLGFEDLVSARLRRSARVLVVLAVLVLIVTLALVAPRDGLTQYSSARSPAWVFLLDPPVLMTVVAVITLIVFEVRGRSLGARATRASTAAELSADDLIRRCALGDLAWASILTGGLAVLVTGLLLLETLGSPLTTPSSVTAWRAVIDVLGGVAVAAVVVRPTAASRRVSGRRPTARSTPS